MGGNTCSPAAFQTKNLRKMRRGEFVRVGAWLASSRWPIGGLSGSRSTPPTTEQRPQMKTRLDAIMNHWSHVAAIYGGADAKRFRTNLKRASKASSETADLFARFEGDGHLLVADDVETLRKAARLLATLADDFEVAQRKSDRLKRDAEALSKSQHEAEIQRVILDLFGKNLCSDAHPVQGDHPVLAMAKDLAYFDRAGVDELAARLRCDRGLISGGVNIGMLQWYADRGQVEPAARILAENRIGMRYPGRAHTDAHNIRWYHASWDDFISWRSIHLQVRAVCQAKGPE